MHAGRGGLILVQVIAAGVDLLVIDTAHGHSEGVARAVERIKKLSNAVQVIAGNVATAEATRETSALPAASGESLRFLPIIGAPVQAVTPLSRQLGAEARARGLTIKSASDASSEHILKGYFSAFADSGNVTITYVWDILDASGGRLHRIQGQEIVPSGAQDPWAAVPASVMQQIATKSMAEYVSWRNSRAG